MTSKSDIFYGKILLFGEYSILLNSMGLTIPYTHFMGELSFIDEDKYTDYDFALGSNRVMKEYIPYLESLSEHNGFKAEFDLEALKADLEKGMYFESNIPQGYGIGSSGALVAAIYKRYAKNPVPPSASILKDDMQHLVAIFSRMESYFHGQSSGIDPLNCYLGHSLLIHPYKDISVTAMPRSKFQTDGAIFLIDTGTVGKTGPLVNRFLTQLKDKEYEHVIRNEYIPLVNNCISHILKGEMISFFHDLKKLSSFQLSNFENMIPAAFRKLWEYGLDSGLFQMKLCGSGGGGFLLGFSTDYEKAHAFFTSKAIEIFPVTRPVTA